MDSSRRRQLLQNYLIRYNQDLEREVKSKEGDWGRMIGHEDPTCTVYVNVCECCFRPGEDGGRLRSEA